MAFDFDGGMSATDCSTGVSLCVMKHKPSILWLVQGVYAEHEMLSCMITMLSVKSDPGQISCMQVCPAYPAAHSMLVLRVHTRNFGWLLFIWKCLVRS